MSNSFTTWLQTAYVNLLSWFGLETQKVASFLYPILKDAEQLVEKDILKDIIAGVPQVATVFESGGLAAAEIEALAYITSVIAPHAIDIAKTTLNAVVAALVAQAQASLAVPAATAA